MNRNLILPFMLSAVFMVGLSDGIAANSLDVNFTGELVAVTCQLSEESVTKRIELYNLRWKSINENQPSAVTPFTIFINNCSEMDLQKSVKLTWQSNQLVEIGDSSFVQTQGDSGIVLGLVDQDENPVIWNEPMNIGTVNTASGSQQFNFGVYARKPATGDVNAGEFIGTVTFNMEYE